jgi:hypothetical protein
MTGEGVRENGLYILKIQEKKCAMVINKDYGL